jgi:hypothetical protein
MQFSAAKLIIIFAFLLTLISCKDKALEAELDQWCACIQDNQVGSPECQDLMIKMSEKYEYDPGAVEIIQKRTKECR